MTTMQDAPPTRDTDYEGMTWEKLRKAARRDRGITGKHNRVSFARLLREQDADAELGAKAVVGADARTTTLLAKTGRVEIIKHTRDALKVEDDQGNVIALVYRLGRNIKGERTVLDMRGNADKIARAFNF